MRKTEPIVASCRPEAGATHLVGCTLLVAAAFLLVVSPVAAQGSDPSARNRSPIVWELRSLDSAAAVVERQGPAGRFYNDHLMPRMSRNFEAYGGVWLTRDAPGRVNQDVVYDVWSQAAERQAYRATRRALTDYVLEETSLSRVLDRLSNRRKGSAGTESTGTRSRPGTVRWDLGISQGLPKVDMRYAVGARRQAELKLSLVGDRRFRVEFRPGQLTRTRLRAAWLFDENECRVGANFSF